MNTMSDVDKIISYWSGLLTPEEAEILSLLPADRVYRFERHCRGGMRPSKAFAIAVS